MRNDRIAYILGFVWEILRFGFVSLTLIYYINPSPDLSISFYVILVGSAQLMIPAGLILITFRPKQYVHLSRLLGLGKALSVIAVVAVLITQSRLVKILIETMRSVSGTDKIHIPGEFSLFMLYAIAVVGLVDLVMALFLIQSGGTSDG